MVEEMETLLTSVRQIEVVYNDMANRMVNNWTERIEEVTKVTGFPTRQLEAVTSRLMSEHHQHGLPITDWLIYNAFNGELNHNSTIKTDEYKRMELDTLIFETLAK